MTTKFETKIIGRLLDRLSKNGLNAAIEYAKSVCGCNPKIIKSVLANAPEPLKSMLEASFAATKSKQKITRDAMAARQAEAIKSKLLAEQALISDFESSRRIGQVVVFLAGLTMAERSLCKPTKQELDAAIAMRRNCLRSTKVRELLKCTDTELKRWSEDGRLPVMYRRRMLSSVGVSLDVRHWDIALVEEASHHLAQWREDDSQERRRKKDSKEAPSRR